ncbi:hypothetical protein CPB85DRAFT_1567747 [Mucidula mucida]|nr:hypothetical protein CPB85DRAFT_1567747 [Mucidula mucida]
MQSLRPTSSRYGAEKKPAPAQFFENHGQNGGKSKRVLPARVVQIREQGTRCVRRSNPQEPGSDWREQEMEQTGGAFQDAMNGIMGITAGCPRRPGFRLFRVWFSPSSMLDISFKSCVQSGGGGFTTPMLALEHSRYHANNVVLRFISMAVLAGPAFGPGEKDQIDSGAGTPDLELTDVGLIDALGRVCYQCVFWVSPLHSHLTLRITRSHLPSFPSTPTPDLDSSNALPNPRGAGSSAERSTANGDSDLTELGLTHAFGRPGDVPETLVELR